jgi:8-oxo-dGTP pyrophosphatase MutT (NUDIX family)
MDQTKLKKAKTSYGIIACRATTDLEYIMVRRRDTVEYVEFMRGKYNLNDKSYLCEMFARMTYEEKNRLYRLSFETNWQYIWFETKNTIPSYRREEYEMSKEKFNKLRYEESNVFDTLVQSRSIYSDYEWEFPKGHKLSPSESPEECAVREFCEETGYSPSDIKIIPSLSPLIVHFNGSNGIQYQYVYYYAIFLTKNEPYIDILNNSQSCEIGCVSWKNRHEIATILRPNKIKYYQRIKQAEPFILSTILSCPLIKKNPIFYKKIIMSILKQAAKQQKIIYKTIPVNILNDVD